MATEFIQKVVEATGGKDRSISWFQNKIREFGSPTSAQLIREGKRRSTPFFGKLNMFFYSPKYKDKLPYYDRFPLVLPLESFKGGFLGFRKKGNHWDTFFNCFVYYLRNSIYRVSINTWHCRY